MFFLTRAPEVLYFDIIKNRDFAKNVINKIVEIFNKKSLENTDINDIKIIIWASEYDSETNEDVQYSDVFRSIVGDIVDIGLYLDNQESGLLFKYLNDYLKTVLDDSDIKRILMEKIDNITVDISDKYTVDDSLRAYSNHVINIKIISREKKVVDTVSYEHMLKRIEELESRIKILEDMDIEGHLDDANKRISNVDANARYREKKYRWF